MSSLFNLLGKFSFALLVITFQQAFGQDGYKVSIDLTKTDKDKIAVEIFTPKVSTSEIDFHLPKIVPGTYSISNFGSFISNFKAFDKSGKQLTVTTKANTWTISNAKKLYKVVYQVDDTWDTPAIKEDVFEPAGTSFEKDTAFVINTFGVIGYLKGNEKKVYHVSIKHPAGFYGSTSLVPDKSSTISEDVFKTDDYYSLTDSPILYSKPDTAWIRVANTSVLVSVFNNGNKSLAKSLISEVKLILEGHAKYLGGNLPVDKYAFLVYLSNKENLTRYGALEHAQSCLMFMPKSLPAEVLTSQFKDIASHEFLHIITPLTIHSEEIGNFDFIDTKMSKHLWLYEGVTEYAAHHSQLYGGSITLQEYLDRQRQKIEISTKNFNDSLPFTEMSKGALDKYKSQYQNVYQKGALIGLCLDIKLLTLSNGTYGLRNLMVDLAKEYGAKKSFKDEELFDKITDLTYSSIRTFFKDYVEGDKPLPLKESFAALGINYNTEATRTIVQISMGFAGGLAPDGKQIVINELGNSSLGKRLGFQTGDIFVSLNGDPFNLDTYQKCFEKYSSTMKLGSVVKLVMLRKQENGELKEVTLEADIREEIQKYTMLEPLKSLKETEQKIVSAWLGN